MYGDAGSQFTNNPFIEDSTHPRTRYPDISGTVTGTQGLSAGQFTSWMQPGSQSANATEVSMQPPIYQQSSLQQPPPPQYTPGYYAGHTSPPFQPTSSFGQQLSIQNTGTSYGYLYGQSTPSSQTAYNPAQQQLQNNPGYAPQFDPYASIGQGWDGNLPNQNQRVQSPTQSTFSSSPSSTGHQHPREYLRTHKTELESWDTYAWKQLLNTFDALKDAWGARKKEVQERIGQLQLQLQYSGGGYQAGQIQQEGSRLQLLLKESESHFDSIAASSFQLREVFSGYRQSGDLASKRRVREASNAAVQGLPDWPPPVY